MTRRALLRAVITDAQRAMALHEAEFEASEGESALRSLEREVLLESLDAQWLEHLDEMDYLKEGIGMRAMAQCEPVVEYHREGYDMFGGMLDAAKERCVRPLFLALAPPEAESPGVIRKG